MAFDLDAHMGLMQRSVRNVEKNGEPAKAVVAARIYDTTPADLWDALTRPERIRRWFAPVSGDLELGGKYQVENNAGGTVLECEKEKHFTLSWEFGGGVSWLTVRLVPEGAGTRLELEHVAPINPHWEQFGPGAVGVGWDLSFMGLTRHLEAPDANVPAEAVEGWYATSEYRDFVRATSDDWGRAAIGAGEDRDHALEAAEATRAFYMGGNPAGTVMHAFHVLGDPVRRRILELLAQGEHASGAVVEVISAEFGISQAGVSQHLKVLRDNGFASVRPEGTRRIYALDTAPLRDIDDWLERFRVFWPVRMEALATEIARGKKQREED